LKKLKKNFGVERVVFVGDKGMVKSSQIEEITSDEYKWNYLTTITKQQIKTLLAKNIIQLELFESEINEHNKAKPDVALRKIEEKKSKLKLKKVIHCEIKDGLIHVEIDKKEQAEQEKLDGCYVVKTNVPQNIIDTQTAHDR